MLREFQPKTDTLTKGDMRPISSDGAYRYFHENGIYKYKGSVSTYMDLPDPATATLENGDVYNIETGAAKDEYGPGLPPFDLEEGDNVAWVMEDDTTEPVTGHWDKLSGNYEDIKVKQEPLYNDTRPIVLAKSNNNTDEVDSVYKNANVAVDTVNSAVVTKDSVDTTKSTSYGPDKISYADSQDATKNVYIPISKLKRIVVEVPASGWTTSTVADATFTNTVSVNGIAEDDDYMISGYVSTNSIALDLAARQAYNSIASGETKANQLIFKTIDDDAPTSDVTLILNYMIS